MSERFTTLYELQKNLFSKGSPIIVSAGSLLKDTQTNNIVVQLKIHSVSETIIKALKVDIVAFDIHNDNWWEESNNRPSVYYVKNN